MHGSNVRHVMSCALAIAGALLFSASRAHAQCPETTFQNYTGAGQAVCPCFAVG
jgi:hypothetical protein